MNATIIDKPVDRKVTWLGGAPSTYNDREQLKSRPMDNQKLLKTGLIGTIVMVICCFTPALVILMGALGLSAYVAGLDFVLLPLLGVSLVILTIALIKRQKSAFDSEDTP